MARRPDTGRSIAGGDRATRLRTDRACIETNMARKGIWRPGAASRRGASTGILELLDTTDQLGAVQRIDPGPALGGLAFEMLVWICSRWRELADPTRRRIPATLAGLTADLGWCKGGGATTEIASALDALTQATFRARVHNARVHNARLRETRIDTFGIIDRWERGARDRPGRHAEPGFIVLGDWLHQQLARDHVTYISWNELRALKTPTARRLLVYLDAERFQRTLRRTIDAPLLATLGITASHTGHQRTTLRRAAAAITAAPNRYAAVSVEAGRRGCNAVLVATRTRDGVSDDEDRS